MLIFNGRHFVESAELDTRTAAGAYVAWLLSSKSAQEMYDWANYIGLINVVSPSEMHATIIYAPDDKLESDIHGDRPLPMPIEVNHHNRPQTRIFGKVGEAGALVTTYDSDALTRRHFQFQDLGLRHGHPSFVPHVTLSYDASAQCPKVMERMMRVPCELPIVFDRERITYAKD